MEDEKKTQAQAWTKEVAGLSKATAALLEAAGKVREARTTLEQLKAAKAKAADDDPDYIISNPDTLDETIGDLLSLEVVLCTQAQGTAEAHKDTDDNLV